MSNKTEPQLEAEPKVAAPLDEATLDTSGIRAAYRRTTMKSWDRRYRYLRFFMRDADFDFVLEARSTQPALLDEVDELRERNRQLVDYINTMQSEFNAHIKEVDASRAYDAVYVLANKIQGEVIPSLETTKLQLREAGRDTKNLDVLLDDLQKMLR